jgi:hypothetical protein
MLRIQAIQQPKSFIQKVVFFIIRSTIGQIPGPIYTFSYRAKWFGKPYTVCLQDAIHRPSEWTVWERELFAAFVSKKNKCEF